MLQNMICEDKYYWRTTILRHLSRTWQAIAVIFPIHFGIIIDQIITTDIRGHAIVLIGNNFATASWRMRNNTHEARSLKNVIFSSQLDFIEIGQDCSVCAKWNFLNFGPWKVLHLSYKMSSLVFLKTEKCDLLVMCYEVFKCLKSAKFRTKNC